MITSRPPRERAATAHKPGKKENENMSAKVETFQFQTETKQLLDLMVHSIYSHKEIFLRELISNASDALDKLRFEALQKPDYAAFTSAPHIRIEADKDKRLLTIHDNGIGMTHDEIIAFIGTIAKSGSREYLRIAREGKADGLPPELIGQFGVGFYSSFMVADRVTLVTRHASEAKAWKWESSGDGAYTLEETERAEPGTSVTLHLKPSDEEDGTDDFTDQWVIRRTVRKYSDFVAYPIRMKTERTETERDEEGKPKPGAEPKTIVEDTVVNSMQAIWTRSESEVKDEEYNEFYKHISHDWNEPLTRISFKAEGRSEFRSLLFIPSKAPFDLYFREREHGIHLYIRRVFIMQDCKELIPAYLRFLRGVVDSEDLSLNISREILQQNRQTQVIRNGIIRKTLDTLAALLKDNREKYLEFWKEFGRVLKEGIFQDQKNKEKVLDVSLFQTTKSDTGWASLEEVVARMPEGQDTIYYLTAESREKAAASPHLEAFREKGYEVLLLTEPVDEVWTSGVFDYKGKKFQSVGKGAVELGTEEERKQAEEKRKESEKTFGPLLECLKAKLGDEVKEVRLSARLTTSPACLVGDLADLSPQLEQILRASGQNVPHAKRSLELNPNHPVVEKLRAVCEKDKDDPRLGDYAELLTGYALLAEGGQLADAAKFTQRLVDLMVKGI
jgi:molecular chaperone HtpG